MNTPFLLYQLQKIDSKLSANEHRLSEISKLLTTDPDLIAAQKFHAAMKFELDVAKDSLTKQEKKIQERRNKLEQSESSLYGGKIKSPKELQDLQKEIASIKSIIAAMEDEELMLMMNVEEKERQFEIAVSKLSFAQSTYDHNSVEFRKESDQIEQENGRLLVERNVLINQIPSPILEKYNNLLAKKGGVAVAKVEDQTCSMCGASLTPAECQSAKSPSTIFICPSCGRILYED